MKREESFPIDYQTRELIPVRSLEIKGKYKDELEGILISGGEIKSRLKALRNEISDYYTQFLKNGEKDLEVVGFPLLGGAMYFYTALVSGEFDKIWFPQILGKTSSYESTESTGKLSIRGYNQQELERLKDKRILLVDDIIDTAGTLIEGTNALLENGAKEVYACCTHPVLSGPAIDRIANSPLKEVTVSNTIPLNDHQKSCNKIKVLSVSKLLGEAIKRIHSATSVSSLFS